LSDNLIDPKAERAVIGSILIDPDAIARAADHVDASDFDDEGLGIAFDAALKLHQLGTPVDFVTICDAIGDNLGKVGSGNVRGAAFLNYLIEHTPSALRVEHYAKIVSRFSTLRGLMDDVANIAKRVYNTSTEDVQSVFDYARRLLDARTPESRDDNLLMWLESFKHFHTLQLERCAELDAQERGTAPPRPTFPWNGLSQYITYARPGTLTGIVAAPGVGKTSLMEGMAEHWAEIGLRVVFFHLELGHQSMLDRRMCRQTGLPLKQLESGYMGPETRQAEERMQGWAGGIHYVHCPGWSAPRIVRQAQKLRERDQCDIAIIDYLQKIQRRVEHGMNWAQATGWSIEVIKNAAEVMGIPFILGSQISKKGREEAMLTSANVRDTGELEEKANLMITAQRELLTVPLRDGAQQELVPAGKLHPVADMRVDKNTFGDTGMFKLAFTGSRFRFSDPGPAFPLNGEH